MRYFHLTTPQQNIWNLQKYYGDTAIGNLCGAIFYKEERNSALLQQAIRMFISSQGGLRLRFTDGNEPWQYVSEEMNEDIPVMTFASIEELDSYAEQFAREPIGLVDRAMYRFVVFRIGKQSGVLVALSHLISDAWTFGLMANQVDAAYDLLADSSECTVMQTDSSECTIVQADYTDYIQAEEVYLSSERFLRDKRFWEEKYAVMPEKTSVKLCPVPPVSITAKRITRVLPMSLEGKIEEYCSHNSVTQAVLFETALVIYLSKINPENRSVTIGIPVLNRSNAKEKRIAGMFVSTMPLTVSINAETTISDLTRQITKGHMDIFRHQKYPYAAILKSLREKQNFQGNLYDVMISYQNAQTNIMADTKWYSNGYSEVPLVLHIDNRDGHESHTIHVDYQTEVFRQEAEAEHIMDRLQYILEQIAEDSSRCIKDIHMVPEKEWNKLIYEFNDTYVEYPREKCVHELFTEQAAKTPDRTALVFEDKKFTYKQLDEMSNSLAHFLREKGVKPNDVVPIIAKRSWHVIVAMLGVLKAGGAYMPVSTEFPFERMQYMFGTAECKLALTYAYEFNQHSIAKDQSHIESIALEDVDYTADIESIENVNHLEDLCYIIFTSGSTGKPKGVSIRHRNTSNYCHDNNNNNVCHKVISDGNRSIVSVTNIVFDIFVTESLLPLLNGLTVYFASDEEVISQNKLSELIYANRIEVLQTTPTKMRSYMLDRKKLDYLSVLKTIILGGEALPEDLYRDISANTKARIFNIYGPAETTVWSTNKEITDERWLVHEQFERMAAAHPNTVALIAGKEKYTYRELDEKSGALAQKLIDMGIQEEKIVGVYLDRTAYVIISQLAVLKAGGIFLPIDHRYPADRIEYMLSDCKVEFVLTDVELSEEWKVNYLNLQSYDFNDVLKKQVKVSPDSSCYIIYTSGSTGKPKGCVLKHRGVANFCANCNIIPYAEQLDHQTVISVNTISFDFFIAESLLPLAHGWTVVLASEEESNNKESLKKLVTDNAVNIIETTPTRLEIYIKDEKTDSYLQQIKLIVSSGEALSDTFLLQMNTVSHAKIFNPLGPSECSVWNVDGDFKTDITIGSPIANTQIYILDKDSRPLPIGVAGELCIAGDGVGKGYLNRPELTAEKFVPNPFAGEENHHGRVMYRTGDLARWRADGEIEYLGRMDTQVKIRGLRIELGEIESVMAGFDGIGLTAAADKRDENNRQYLVGYYTAESGIDEKELRRHLAEKLPKYMVPNYFVHLEHMPMTPSGKTDRKNLPVPDVTLQENIYIPLETATEKKLAEIWQGLLHVEKVGKTDDFFELGGDSLLAIAMLNEIENTFCVEISVNDIMEKTSVEQLALCIDNADKVHRIPVCHEKRYVLLPQQKAIYAVCSKNPDTLAYNMPARILLPESIDRDRLKNSICQVINSHKLLKSHIAAEGDEIYGIYDEDVIMEPEEYGNGKEEAFIRPFDLGQAPLVHIGFTEDSLLVDMHHIVADGESLNIILRDILKVYGGETLQNSGVEYSDYAKYFYGFDKKEHKDYFKEMLKCDFEPLELPRTRNPKQGGKSGLYDIPEEIFAGAKAFARENDLSDTMVFLAAYGIMLSKYTAKSSILSSIIMRNRIHADTQNTVGMFVNTLPVHLSVEGRTKEYLQNIKQLVMNLFRYQELPFWDIANTVGMSDKSVVNTSFVYQGDGEKALTLNGEKLVPKLTDTHTAKFDLSMELTPLEHGCRIRMEYNCEKHDEVLMDKLADAYIRILKQLNKEKIADISVLSQEEYQKIIYEFNDTYVEYPREKCVHELFTEQAAKTPDRTALVFEDKKFTYKQLDEMSNSLAHFLREKGVKPNDVVPIIAKRSWHVIVAMLGVLKAGGAYMPVDTGYPMHRIEYMLKEIKAELILTYGWKKAVADSPVIELEDMDYSCNTEEIANINKPADLSYVLFTSGSTGKPKATLITHANLGNFVNNNNNNKYQCAMVDTCKNVLADTIFTFDISVFEIYLTLLNGLTVILTKEMADTKYIAGLIEKYEVDVIHTTPTKISMVLQNKDFQKAIAGVKMLMIGAETFSEELYQTIAKYTDAVVYNGYGPTETTIGCSFKRINHREKCVHELFTEQAAKTPDRTALVFEDKKFTYKQLDEMSNSLAHFLREKGVKPNDVVPIIAKRSWHVIVAMLGVLKAGGAYMLIDYQYPVERIKYLVEEGEAKCVLTYGAKYEKSFSLEDLCNESHTDSLINLNNVDGVFTVIHTSGSTGKPKVTSLTHRNIAHYINYSENFFREIKQVIATTVITFDAFIQETIVPLCKGIPVVLFSENEMTKQEEFERKILNYNDSFMFQTPTKLLNYIRNSKNRDFLTAIKCFALGGEVFPQELYEMIYSKNPNCRSYNIYGPTETTICCNVKMLESAADITIGSPIANTQIYILDKDSRPLPIGVAGELCIAGDGVGKGYLNRPELTAEKFVPNPFAGEENHHGRVMYRTGDLARWRADGEIEYLGRMDTQVKIRGLRIELGEIESVMAGFDGIGLTAAADKRDENNRQYLVGYYTAESGIDEKELRRHLTEKLPKYMVPNYFVHLEHMPMTPSGKTDRKNLPVPDVANKIIEYVAPETEQEAQLCHLLEGILHMERVGAEDDFFEYGGDSLGAIEYVAKAHDMGIEFALQNVFDYPTVRLLCDYLNGGTEDKVRYAPEDFEKYRCVFENNIVDDSFVPKKKTLGNVLLTGATGFLGAHVLHTLMQQEEGKIYCLIRSNRDNDRRGRLREILKYYFGEKYEQEFHKRIILVVGDIEQKGLSEYMPEDVQTVIHTAASVKHYGSYGYFHKVNVEGTQHVIDYAKAAGAKLIHVSTLSVSGNSMADDFSVYRSAEEKHFCEKSFYIGQPLDNVYIHSKFEAEKRVYDAILNGLDAKVIRVGNLTNRTGDYKFQPNYRENAFLTRVKAILEFGLFPDYLMPLYSEFSPVDLTAEGIVKIAQYADKQTIFHLNSNRPIYFDRFLEVVHKLGISMRVVDGNIFHQELQKTMKNTGTEYIFEAFQNDMDEQGHLVYDSNIRIENEFTLWFLKQAGFEWNETDMEYISGYIDYFRTLGYLEV